MSTLYYKTVVFSGFQGLQSHGLWGNVANWFTNPEATIQAVAVPWVTSNIYNDYDLDFANGETIFPLMGEAAGSAEIGNGFTINGICRMPLTFGFPAGEDGGGNCSIYGGTYSASIILVGATINGGVFQSNIGFTQIYGSGSVGYINNGTFQGAVNSVSINYSNNLYIGGGVFQSTVTLGPNGVISGGIFNGAVNINLQAGNNAPITGGIFNGSFTQTSGNVSGGTFNGSYTRVAGNVTGGTFNNGLINQFYRGGWPPPIIFNGYNTNALDSLVAGLG